MRGTAIAQLVLMALTVSATGAARPARAGTTYSYILKDLGTLGGDSSIGEAVNDSGQVTGTSVTAGGEFHAFLSGPGGGALKDLGTLGGDFSIGLGVNASGQVVGYSLTEVLNFFTEHAFLYSGGRMLDLNDLIAPGSGLTLVQAASISDTGYITGEGRNSHGQERAFLLTPVPEPSGLVLLGTGLFGILGVWWLSRGRTYVAGEVSAV